MFFELYFEEERTISRQYAEMLQAAMARLTTLDLKSAAEKAGMRYDPPYIMGTTFGQTFSINLVDYRVEPELNMWHYLTILQYLESVDGRNPNDVWIGLSDFPNGGAVRGVSFDREIGNLIASGLSACTPERMIDACEALGGRVELDGQSDISAVIFFLSKYPLRFNLWLADDEFSASGRVLLNDAVKQTFGVEAAGTIATILIQKLIKKIG
ncbi:MAG: DUF3786 domain-containing protein [Clostridia bacterium]|nr:DUF3786 domain-containing protein [Clostridia bacterium]